MKQKKSKRKPWVRPRHRVVTAILRLILTPVCRIRYGLKVRRFRDKRQVLAVMNHQTAFDQFFVSLVLGRPVYYLASEDLFSLGWVSSLIRYLVAPIPIRKSATDARAVMTAMRVAKEGGSIAVFPEGNRTYSGKTGNIKESIAPFARALRLPIAVLRAEGGYGVHPRWSDTVRRGVLTVGVVRVIEPEEYASLSDAELYALLVSELAVDESTPSGAYRGAHRAEYLERAIYYCPFCGFARFESHGARVRCTSCGREVEYGEDKSLSGVGFPFPYRTMTEWCAAEEQAMRELALAPYLDTPLFRDTASQLEVIPFERRRLLHARVTLSVYADRFTLAAEDGVREIPFDSVTAVSVLGRNKLNIYVGAEIVQLKGDERFCALKYMHTYYRVKNEMEGDRYAEFLGI